MAIDVFGAIHAGVCRPDSPNPAVSSGRIMNYRITFNGKLYLFMASSIKTKNDIRHKELKKKEMETTHSFYIYTQKKNANFILDLTLQLFFLFVCLGLTNFIPIFFSTIQQENLIQK